MIPGLENQFFFRPPADILLKNAFGDRWNEETGHGGALRAHPSAHGISGGKIWERPGGLRPGAEKGAAGGRGGRGPWRQGPRKGGDRRKSGKGREPGYRSEVKNISGAVGCKGGHDPGNGHGSLWERGLQKKDGGYEGAVPDHRGKRRGSGGQHPPEQLSPGGGFRRPGLLL